MESHYTIISNISTQHAAISNTIRNNVPFVVVVVVVVAILCCYCCCCCLIGKTGDISEEDPVWLKAKGDDFFRSGDVRSAVNAYSAAIDIDDEAVACYSNRSACYLKLNMSIDCVEDCSMALQLLLVEQTAAEVETTLALTDNNNNNSSTSSSTSTGINPTTTTTTMSLAKQRAKLLMRRAGAFSQMGKFASAVEDYLTAQLELQLVLSAMETERKRLSTSPTEQLSPAEAAIQKDIAAVEADRMRMELLRDVDALKQQADALFAERLLPEAREKYDEVQTNPNPSYNTNPSYISNPSSNTNPSYISNHSYISNPSCNPSHILLYSDLIIVVVILFFL